MDTVIFILVSLIDILELLIVIRCILSWIPNFQNAFVELLYKLTDPFLVPIQNLLFKLLGRRGMMVDFSPIILYLLLELLATLLHNVF